MSIDAIQLYMGMALKVVSLGKKWHVIVDPGCGATHKVAPDMLKAMGCKSPLLTLNQTDISQHENPSQQPNHSAI